MTRNRIFIISLNHKSKVGNKQEQSMLSYDQRDVHMASESECSPESSLTSQMPSINQVFAKLDLSSKHHMSCEEVSDDSKLRELFDLNDCCFINPEGVISRKDHLSKEKAFSRILSYHNMIETEETLNISNEYYAQMTEECKKSLQEQQKNQHLAQINKKMREADKEVQRDPVYQRINKIINKANESDIKVNDK